MGTSERGVSGGISFIRLFEMRAELNPSIDGGDGPAGRRILDAAAKGLFDGPRLRGEINPGTGDWRLVRHDGTMVVDARLVLKTDDGAVIHMSYGGRIVIPSEVLSEVRDERRRHLVDPARYYFRTTPVFETGAEEYAWLNNIVCIGTGRLGQGRSVVYEVFQIL